MKYFKNIEFWYFFTLILLVTLPILAPILSAVGLHSISEKIYLLFSLFCHQFDTRSLHLFDYQYAWCARDFGIWIGILTGSVLYKFKILKALKLWHLIIYMIPIALDGGVQTITILGSINPLGIIQGENFYASNNLFRFLTGSFFGIGVALLLAQNLVEVRSVHLRRSGHLARSSVNIQDKGIELLPKQLYNKNWKRIILTILFLFSIYFVLIQMWDLSSHQHKPANILDSTPKIQQDYFFIRRLHGECPADEESGLFNFECLL